MAHVTVCDDSLLACEYKCRKFLEEAGINLHQLSVKPLVGIIMGSDSDLPVMKAAAETLELFGIPFEVTIVSAHRTPERMLEYGRGAEKRGLKVIIAGAGGAAHLPGMVASLTTLPVIGVPVALKHLDGMDSLYSIVQMPRGVPVATVAINNSTNAGLLAARIIGVKESTIRHRMSAYQEKMTDSVMQKVDNLSSSGWKNYVTK
jgi:phosphoribosylaminoimidazole carboxylase